MTISTTALASSSDAVISLVGSLGTYAFGVLAVTIGLGVGIWFLRNTVKKAKGAAK